MASFKVPFTVTAGPDTDIWRKPPAWDVWKCASKTLDPKPLDSFVSATVTFRPTNGWTSLYDQGGVYFSLTPPSQPATSVSGSIPPRWLKTGIEFYESSPYIATAGCENWADWSLYPTTSSPNDPISLLAEVEGEGEARSLWIYWLYKDGQGNVSKKPVREVCWFMAGAKSEGWQVEVGAYAVRPAKEQDVIGKKELDVEFLEFNVKWN